MSLWLLFLLQFVDSPEVEKEVKRLLREDCNAVRVCILMTIHVVQEKNGWLK